jgi:hypothetical protein
MSILAAQAKGQHEAAIEVACLNIPLQTITNPYKQSCNLVHILLGL